MKKSITILLLLIMIPTVTHAGWWSDLFGKKTLNNTTSQKNVNTNTTNTTIGDTKNTIEGDKNTINVPDEQKSYILNFKDLDTIFGEKLSEANKTASQGVLYLGKSNEIINKASSDNVKQSKENTDVISKNLLEIKEIQGGILKLGTDYPGIQTTVNIPSTTQMLLETLNANIVTPLVNLGAKIESLTNQSLLNNNALISAINNMSSIPSSGGSVPTITQTAHGFVVGDWVYLVGTVYTKTTSNLAASADSVGVVTSIPTANTFTLLTEGYATGLSGLTAGTRYYLGATAGAITATAPSSNIKAVFIADSATSGYVQQYAIGQSSLPGTIAQVFASGIVTPSASQINASTSVLIPGMTTTLTPNGTTRYLVMTSVRARSTTTAQNNSVDGGIQAALFDSTAPTVAIANSEVLPIYNVNQNTISVNSVSQQIQATSGSSYVLTISSPMTLQVRAWNVAAATTGTVMADNNGRTSMTIIQLDNKLPVSGLVEYGDTINLNNQVFSTTSFVASTNGSYIFPEAGVYTLRYDVATDGTGLNTNSHVAIFDNTGTLVAGTERTRGGGITSAQVLTAETRVTTSGAATYTLRGRSGGGGAGSMTILNGTTSQSSISWRSAGASAAYGGIYPGTWINYTPTITATAGGTNPTLPTSATITGSYTVQGKVMLLNIRYSALTTTLGTAGTQSYSFNLPAGYTIDTTKATLPSDVTNASLSGIDGATIGTGFLRNSSNVGGATVVAVSTTGVGLFTENNVRLVGAGAFALNGAANSSYSFTAQIPLN